MFLHFDYYFVDVVVGAAYLFYCYLRMHQHLRGIRKIARSKEIKNYVAYKRITWTFITPRASWVGGSWERMVNSVKRCLKKTLGRSLLTFEDITTIVCEIEAVLNDRPITYCYDDEGGI